MQQLQVMNFLNEIATQFPEAISLASGRPQSTFFNKQAWQSYEDSFTAYYATAQNCSIETAQTLLCQYGPSAGVINGILQRHLALDEAIETDVEEFDMVVEQYQSIRDFILKGGAPGKARDSKGEPAMLMPAWQYHLSHAYSSSSSSNRCKLSK